MNEMTPAKRAMAALCVILAVTLSLSLVGCGNKPAAQPTDAHSDEHAAEHSDDHADKDEHGDGAAVGEDHHDDDVASTSIPADVAQSSGIRVAPVAAGVIADEHEVQGLLTPVEGRVAQVMARFPGPIRAVHAGVGDKVRAGQVLASIESNLSLTTYTVTSPLTGTVLQRAATVGAVAGEGMPLFEIVDLSTLWVDLHIFGNDAGHITAGIPVTVTRLSDGVSIETTLERILPATATASQSTVARARIINADGLWRPGSAVRARIVVDRADAALVVPLTALQTDAEGRDVVYVREQERYEARLVTLARRDASNVEVTAGLTLGEQVVVAQSFLVKADIGKSTAAHEH